MASVDNPDTHTPWGAQDPPPPPPQAPSSSAPPPTLPPPPSPHATPHIAPYPPYVSPQPGADNALRQKGRYLIAGSIIAAMVVGAIFVVRAAQPAPWDPVLEPYVAFVEEERGLTFDRPVNVRWANIAEDLAESFEADREDSTFSADQVDPYAEAYRLLGLVDPDPESDLAESQDQTATENAGAFYEPWSESIVLPEGVSLDALSFTIVHELTHALQDQNGMLAFHPDSADGSTARTALIEGDAERIAVAWYMQLSAGEQQTYLDAIGANEEQLFEDPGNSFLAASFYASYSIGLPVTQTIVETEGVEALNRLMLAKDAGTTERLIDVLETSPRSAVKAEQRIDLPDGATSADGDLGALVWFQTLAPIVGTEAAFDALIGYDNDAFAIFVQDDQVCGRVPLFFDNRAEAQEFHAITEGIGFETSPLSNSISVRNDVCDPIGDPEDQRFGTIMPLTVANEMLLVHLQNDVDPKIARCAAFAQASTIPANRSAEEFVGWDTLDAAAPQFVERCR